jgi:RND family efflux transporter MFP subunit
MRNVLGLPLLAAGLAALGCGQGPPPLAPPEPPAVTVIHPAEKKWADYTEFTGRLTTKDPVQVRPRVTGYLVKRLYKDGDLVEAGKTPLYEIEKTLFEADVVKAKADLENYSAQIKLYEAEMARQERALRGNAAAQADVDKAKAQRDVSVAQAKAAAATLTKAEQNLEYCTIIAPTNGRIRQSSVTEGSLVNADQTVLTEIFPIDPIYALWEVDELVSLQYRRRIQEGIIPDPRVVPLKCWIKLKNETEFSRESVVDYFDPIIVRGTGTRTIRATFPNPKAYLSAGDSVRVRVEAGPDEKVIVVPDEVVLSQQREKYVYVVNDKDEVEYRPVELGDSRDGLQVITKGLTPKDRVAATNLLRVRPGVKVKIQSQDGAAVGGAQ